MIRMFANIHGQPMEDHPSMWTDMDIDPEEAMAMMEAMSGEASAEKLVDSEFYNKFEDDFDDEDLD